MQNANNFFGNSAGSENLYRHSFTHFVYTDGVKTMARDCQAYWLIDLIISHQTYEAVKKEAFQVWNLKKVEGNYFSIVCTDGNHNKVTSQEIPFSDFPYDVATLWLVNGCIMMPTEY
jgi:hypothetical protein